MSSGLPRDILPAGGLRGLSDGRFFLLSWKRMPPAPGASVEGKKEINDHSNFTTQVAPKKKTIQ